MGNTSLSCPFLSGCGVGGPQGAGRPQLQERGGDPADDAGRLQQEAEGVGDHEGHHHHDNRDRWRRRGGAAQAAAAATAAPWERLQTTWVTHMT